MPASKIVSEDEIVRWIKDGKTYQWMADEYARKYNVHIVPSAFSNFRRRHGLDNRITRNDDLIPWHVLPKHRWRYPVAMLRAEARRRDGQDMRQADTDRLPAWLSFLEENNVVVHYDPELEEGFVYVPRDKTDEDIIRQPAKKTTLRRTGA